MGGHHSPLRPELLRVVREHVRDGSYRPPTDDVAELLAALLLADGHLDRRPAA